MIPRLARVAAASLLLPALSLVTGCVPRPASETAPSVPAPRVVVLTAAGASLPVDVELARSEAELARGLMHRRELGPEAGMLFLFPANEPRTFWMKNTLIPLDMLFIDDGGRVVGLVERAEPLTTSPRESGAPSRYVLEVNGGWAARHGVRPGDRVRFENVPRF